MEVLTQPVCSVIVAFLSILTEYDTCTQKYRVYIYWRRVGQEVDALRVVLKYRWEPGEVGGTLAAKTGRRWQADTPCTVIIKSF